jgi:hypothetical protein
MEPIGLRFKHDGELMIVHRCLSCGKISVNRIAGDDTAHIVLTLIAPVNHARQFGMQLLTKMDEKEIRSCLFGYGII